MKQAQSQRPRSRWKWATKGDLEEAVDKIMSAITDWAAKEDADLTGIKAELDAAVATGAKVAAGVADLLKIITDFQSAPGTISPADQATLDALETRAKSLDSQAGLLASQLAAISTTPPTPPTAPAP